MATNDEEIIKKYNLLFGAASEIDLENALDEARAEGYKEGQKAECQKWIDALKGLQTYHAEVYSEAGMGGVGEDSYVEFERVKNVALYKNKMGILVMQKDIDALISKFSNLVD